MLRLAAQPYLMFAESIKTFGWWKKIYVTHFCIKFLTFDKLLDGNNRIDNVCTIEFREMRNGDMYVMKEKYEQMKY